jgi:hypothetical protein
MTEILMPSLLAALAPRIARALALAASASGIVGCGGTVVFEEGGAGDGGAPQVSTTSIASGAGSTATSVGPSVSSASGGGAASTSVGSTASVSSGDPVASVVSTGPGLCTAHEDCPGALCIFATGECASACSSGSCDACTPGEVCEDCATSSCPDCFDCVSACRPTGVGRCDEDDPCLEDDHVCIYPSGFCAPSCDSSECADPNMVCEGCATGSCCGCDDCVSACFPLEG